MDSPYRNHAARDEQEPRWTERVGDTDLLPFFVILWLGSVARVAAALASRETFQTEATLAFLVVLILPFVIIDGQRSGRLENDHESLDQ